MENKFADNNNNSLMLRLRDLNLGLSMFIVAWVSSIQLKSSYFISGYIIFAMFIIWSVLAFILNSGYLKSLFKNHIISIALFVLLVSISSILGTKSLNSSAINYIILLMMFCIYVYYDNYGSNTEKRVLLLTALAALFFSAVVTVYYLIINPAISRQVSTGWYEGNLHNIVGGLFFIYSLIPVIIAGLTVLKHRLDYKTGYLLLLILLFILTVLSSNFATATILLIVIIPFIYFRPNIKKFILVAAILCVSLLTLVIVYTLFPNIVENFLSTFLYPQLAERIINIFQIFTGDLPSSSSLYERMLLINKSTDTIISSPLFGVFGKSQEVVSKAIGGHMQWLDDFASYGLIGIIPFWYFMSGFVSNLIKRCSFAYYKKAIYLIIIYFVIWGFMNPVMKGEVFSAIFIVTPFMPYILNEKDKTDESTVGM